MRIPRARFSIRLKIFSLITGALTVSLLSYIYVGSGLMVSDKTSYIYDYSLAQVSSSSDKIHNYFQKVVLRSRVVSNLLNPSYPPSRHTAEIIYKEGMKTIGVSGLLILRPDSNGSFRLELEYGGALMEAQALLAQLGWTPTVFEQNEVLIGTSLSGQLPVGGKTQDAEGRQVMFLALVDISSLDFVSAGSNSELQVLDAIGRPVIRRSKLNRALPSKETLELARGLLHERFESGVRDWSLGPTEYITAYQSLFSDQLLVLNFIPKDIAFAAADSLVRRSLALGVSILLIALGFTIFFVKGLTDRLREMWAATKKVASGDFSCRVEVKGGAEDELESLAVSFNSMADKIDELMLATAQKARMEKELETAEVVQKLFFPTGGFDHPNLRLTGKLLPASECSGDWWHYAQIGEYLVAVVGDVTGHGVSAALVTAAAHATFTTFLTTCDPESDAETLAHHLIHFMNTGVCSTSGKKVHMTLVASFVDLRSGTLTIANAGHNVPYLYRSKFKAGEKVDVRKKFTPLVGGRGNPLGTSADADIRQSIASFDLSPGDTLFWYTDGLMEATNAQGNRRSKKEFLSIFSDIADQNALESQGICDAVMSDVMEFRQGSNEKDLDDVTLIVASVPKTASFQRRAKPESPGKKQRTAFAA